MTICQALPFPLRIPGQPAAAGVKGKPENPSKPSRGSVREPRARAEYRKIMLPESSRATPQAVPAAGLPWISLNTTMPASAISQ